jgi:conjugative relaxase-like TrwC/TraI family protein
MGARSTVSGFDLTFSAPKSVSVLFAVEDAEVARALLAAHERAVDAAVEYLEREACWTRRGRDGVDRVRGDGFIAASYRHRMSRAGDPQLHTHVVIANMTRADGRYTALDARSIYEHKSAAGAVYRAVVRAEVRERLPWLSWRQTGRGLFELDGIPEPVLRHFSQRRVEIEERALELAGIGAADGLSRERMQGIALATRKAKDYGVDGPTWRQQAHARAAEHGLGKAELAALRNRAVVDTPMIDVSALADRLSGAEGLTGTHNTFAPRHALAEIAGAFPQGARLSDLDVTTGEYLAHDTVVRLRGECDGLRYTTVELLARERELVDGAQRRASDEIGILSPALVDRALAAQAPALNEHQTTAVRSITSSGRGVEAITALAGTGKTTMVSALARAYEQAGWNVIGAAPTARAARQLRDVAGIDAMTMHALLAQIRRSGGLNPQTLLVLDEAGMAPTRRSADLFAYAELAGAKVVAVGDPGQLGPVEAGGWLATLSHNQQGPALRDVMRQRNPEEQHALHALHDGDPSGYLTHKHDTITVHQTEVEALVTLTDAWYAAQLEHGRRQTVMITRDNLTRERLNRTARAKLVQDGTVSPTPTIIGGREYARGDRVIARRNDRHRDIDNGSLATIIALNPDDGSMIIHTDSGQPRALDAGYVANHVEHAYALTAHSAQGATVTWAGVIGRPAAFTREWAYTALSRARNHTTIHLITQRSEHDRERDEYAPAEPDPTPEQALIMLRQAMARSEHEPLAADQGPPVPSPAPTPLSKPRVPEPDGEGLLRQHGLKRGRRSLRL